MDGYPNHLTSHPNTTPREKGRNTMKIIIKATGINNFHNRPDIMVRVSGEEIKGFGERLYRVSRRQVLRIEKHFCGSSDCRCAKGGVVVETSPDGEEFGLRRGDIV